MPESTSRAILTCLVATAMVVGFTAAPVAGVDDPVTVGDDEVSVDAGDRGATVEEEGVEVRTGDDDPGDVVDGADDGLDGESDEEFPEEVCTDAGDVVQENVPVEDVPWLSDLPEEAQPPNVPADLVTPGTVTAIVFGATPNQCDVQDPNDPSYDPREDDVNPDADATPAQGDYKDGTWGLVVYELTLDQSGSGPGVEGMIWTLGSSEDGTLDTQVTINDGEKDYAVNPRIGYRDDGTASADAEAWALGKRAGAGVDCDGEECQPDTDGVPQAGAPAIPAPTGQNEDQDSDESDEEFPEEVCTDIGEEVHDGVPWSDLPWISDLPEEAQPPNVPADLVTPRTASSIVVGVTPNQCDVQDPNDPSYDPREDDVNPDADATPAQGDYKDGTWGLVMYEATLDQSGDGPGIEGMIWTLGSSEDGTLDTQVTINDGEKDYAVNPRIGYRDDGSGSADLEFRVLGKRAGAGVDCDGEECQPDTDGVPETGAPAVPAPTGQNEDQDSDESDEEFPEEVCTGVGKEVANEVPWGNIPWISATPNQCDVQDPNDPSYDPREDDVDPDASVTPAQSDYKDGTWGLVVYELTLDQSGSGPGVEGMIWTVGTSEYSTVDPGVTINDGEKDYAVNPRITYWDGSADVTLEAWAIGNRAGAEVVCTEDGCDGGPT